MLELYKVCDYKQETFRKFFRYKIYLKLQDKIKTIAIYKSGGGLGDLVQSIPLFRSFKEMFSKAEIIYLGLYQKPRCDTIFRNIPYIDKYIEYIQPGKENSFKEYFHFFSRYFRKFDLIIDTQPKLIPSFYLWLLNPEYFLSRMPFFSSWSFLFNSKKEVHIATKMLSLARILGYEVVDFNPVINISGEYLYSASDYLKNFSGPFISILPGAGHPYKMWDKQSLASLADMFYAKGYQVILVGSESEKELILEVIRMMKHKPIVPLFDEPIFGRDPIYSIGLFKSSLLTIGADCGGLHLATLAGCPVIGIFGPTNPVKSGPLGEKNMVIYKAFSCSPCRLKGCKVQRRCLTDIKPDEVIRAAEFILRG